jgi:hypothetical protein
MRWRMATFVRPRHPLTVAYRLSTLAYTAPMHYDAHQPVINDLEARILTIRDSL